MRSDRVGSARARSVVVPARIARRPTSPARGVLVCLVAALLPLSPASVRAAEDERSGAAASGVCAGVDCATVPAVHDRWDRARRLRYGYGMTADPAQAFRWYERSAERGDARAMHNVGLMLVRGQGVERDVEAGRAWLHRSLARNAVESALALAEMARLGIGGPIDHERAAKLYRRAADAGDVRAMHALGNLHAGGLGVRRSDEDALFWYLLASDKGHANAAEAARSLRARLDAEAIAEAEFRAMQWRTTPRRGK